MTTEERIELAVRRARSRMLKEFPQDMGALLALEYLSDEIAYLGQHPQITDDPLKDWPRDGNG